MTEHVDTEIDVDGSIANAYVGGLDFANLFCFAQGTWITTPSGQVPIEKLAAGDMVVTMDHGPATHPLDWLQQAPRNRQVRPDPDPQGRAGQHPRSPR